MEQNLHHKTFGVENIVGKRFRYTFSVSAIIKYERKMQIQSINPIAPKITLPCCGFNEKVYQ